MGFSIFGLCGRLRFIGAALFNHFRLPFANAAQAYQIFAGLDCSSCHPGYDGKK